MKIQYALCLAGFLSTLSSTQACGLSLETCAQQAIATNEAVAARAITALRQNGRSGLESLLRTHASLVTNHAPDDLQWQRLRTALDAVGGQRDCFASRLFWHTNFAAAQTEAQRSGRPILSLRLLGRLDEELSCANSRFFRTTLYANREVSDYLRDHFVLHWKSVRPAPRITIDMGDGRRIERTITGNSIHYVLDANGEVIDGLPGLYSPRAFLSGLKQAEQTAVQVAKLGGGERARVLGGFHREQLDRINRAWGRDLTRVPAGPEVQRKILPVSGGATPDQFNPVAAAAMPLAVSKSGIERPMLRAVTPVREAMGRTMTDELWARIAALHESEALLDANSVALIRAKTVPAEEAMRLASAKERVEDPMLKMLRNLQRSISEDTVRNEYTFHAKIHEWLAARGQSFPVESLNARVYDELFLTPDSDPWLGLAPAETFSALENGGLSSRAQRR